MNIRYCAVTTLFMNSEMTRDMMTAVDAAGIVLPPSRDDYQRLLIKINLFLFVYLKTLCILVIEFLFD
jgi:hypothetical protein